MKTITKTKFIGSNGIMFLWILFFWPGAIAYYFARCEKETIKVK